MKQEEKLKECEIKRDKLNEIEKKKEQRAVINLKTKK